MRVEIALLLASIGATPAFDNVKQLDYGSFRGRHDGKATSYFNIPFAAPPIGPLRFKNPQLPLDLKHLGIRDSSIPGPSCMVDPAASVLNRGAIPSEDCLQLNVFAPSSAKKGDNLPVFVYVFGGGFTDGYSTFPYGFGARQIIENNNVIIVTMNYRLGAFGYLPSLLLKDEENTNLGIKDVAASFKWVRRYINEFGGNPQQVTAFGFSAGAITLGTLLMAEDGDINLFDRVVLMSGGTILLMSGAMPYLETIEGVQYIAEYFNNLVNCTMPQNLECLRALSAHDMLQASIKTNNDVGTVLHTSFGPFVDGFFIRRQHHDSLSSGLFRKIPVMINTNIDEAMFFIPTDSSLIDSFTRKLFPYMTNEEIHRLKTLYPDDGSALVHHNVSQILTDFFFQCPARLLAKTYTDAGLPVFKSLFKHELALLTLPGLSNHGVTHGSDIPFWFQLQSVMIPFGNERQLSRAMLKALIDFGSCPDPKNCIIGGLDGSMTWPQYGEGSVINLETPIRNFDTMNDDVYADRCDYFHKVIFSAHGPIHANYATPQSYNNFFGGAIGTPTGPRTEDPALRLLSFIA